MEEANVIQPFERGQLRIEFGLGNLRLVTRFADFFVNTAPATIHGAILSSHDGLDRAFRLDVSCKSWNLGETYDNLEDTTLETALKIVRKNCLEFLSPSGSTDDTFDKGSRNLIGD